MSAYRRLAESGGLVHAFIRGWMVLLGAVLLVACQPELPEGQRVDNPASSSLFLELRTPTGEAVPDATVHLASGHPVEAGNSGQVVLEELPVGHLVLHVKASGFVPSMLALDIDKGGQADVRLELLPWAAPRRRAASQGNTLEEGDNRLTVPPNSLLDARGNPVQIEDVAG